MTKGNFIALADVIRDHNRIANHPANQHPENKNSIHAFTEDQIIALAKFCRDQSSSTFKRDRWLGYVAGTNGVNGGAL
jgi:hypothetical protein